MSTNLITPAKPTKLIIEKNAEDKITKGRVEDVTLLYTNLQEGNLMFGSETERSLDTQFAVTKDTARNWRTTFPKNGYREVTNEQFVKSFKIDPPYPEQEDQYIIKLGAPTKFKSDLSIPPSPSNEGGGEYKAGDLVPYEMNSRPKLFEVRDGKPVDITQTVRVANGSKGVVAFRTVSHPTYGTFPRLSGIIVTELIEQAQRDNMISNFGDVSDTKRLGTVAGSVTNDDSVDMDSVPQLQAPALQEMPKDDDWF